MIGTKIGNYRVERLIGEGGMGKVYLAVHPGIGRQAAVKVLPLGEASDPQIVSRFLAEARASNAIRHPNIIDIYDSGVLPDGLPYIVMEYLAGKTLTQRLLEGPVELADALDWASQVAEALCAAHAHDVVHRDLKPDNLLLIADPRRFDKKLVKVLDFGIAKLRRPTLGQVHKTRTGSLLGTPLYMAPEQCLGAKDVDERADIYSLGVILYEMVCGRRPFDSEAVFAVINMHIHERPVSPEVYRPEIPVELRDIILRALAKSPADRQSSMAELLSQLHLVRGDPQASQEALLRAARASVTQAKEPPPHASVSAGELRTLADTAVSKGSTAPSAARPKRTRASIYAVAAALVAIAAVYAWLGRSGARDVRRPAPLVTVPASTPTASAPAPAARKLVEIPIDSVPTGASVWVGNTLIGVTPATYLAHEGDAAVEFVFRAAGFAEERMRALPSQSLKITARLTELPTAKPESTGRQASKRKSTRPAKPDVPSDIKFER